MILRILLLEMHQLIILSLPKDLMPPFMLRSENMMGLYGITYLIFVNG